MRNSGGETGSTLLGTREQVGVSRGLAEFRATRPVIVTGNGRMLLCIPVEGLDTKRLMALRALCAPASPKLVLTGRRARSLGFDTDAPVAIEIGSEIDVSTIKALVADAKPNHEFIPIPASAEAT